MGRRWAKRPTRTDLRSDAARQSIGVTLFSGTAHFPLEALAYAVGFGVYRAQRRRAGDFLGDDVRWSLIVAAVLGAALGSKVLHHAADPVALVEHAREPLFWLGGKTIVGALLGGWFTVEWQKRRLGIVRATGDLYVVPLCVGIAIGRVGCLLSGVNDATHGSPTTLWWGMDLGDGVARHPTQLIEIVFVTGLGLWLARARTRRTGDLFLLFVASYLGFRFAVDFLKPIPRLAGLGGIQWACLAGVLWCARVAWRRDVRTIGAPTELRT